MGNFKMNPEEPFEVRVPNKIRKRIAMHKTKRESVATESLLSRALNNAVQRASLISRVINRKKKRGSMWSRFASRVANILQIKPSGERK